MHLAIQTATFVALLVAGAWTWYDPKFDSFIALITAVAAFLGAVVVPKKKSQRSQSQTASGNGVAVQAGRDVNIGAKVGCGDKDA